MSEQQHTDQLDQVAGDQLEQPADQDQLEQPADAGDQLAVRSDGGDNGPQDLDPAQADAIADQVQAGQESAGDGETTGDQESAGDGETTGDQESAGDGETTGDQETAPTFPDPDLPLVPEDLEDRAVTQPNPYSPGFGVTGKFPASDAIQDDGYDTGAGDQVEDQE